MKNGVVLAFLILGAVVLIFTLSSGANLPTKVVVLFIYLVILFLKAKVEKWDKHK